MDMNNLDIPTLKLFAVKLDEVLSERTHKRIHLGEEIIVKGSLSSALKVPTIIKELSSAQNSHQENGRQLLLSLWPTLSLHTRNAVLERSGWYNPEELDWDDPRSNRKPLPQDQD